MTAEIIPFFPCRTMKSHAEPWIPDVGDAVALAGVRAIVIGRVFDPEREPLVGVNMLDGRGISIVALSRLKPWNS